MGRVRPTDSRGRWGPSHGQARAMPDKRGLPLSEQAPSSKQHAIDEPVPCPSFHRNSADVRQGEREKLWLASIGPLDLVTDKRARVVALHRQLDDVGHTDALATAHVEDVCLTTVCKWIQEVQKAKHDQ